MCGVIMFDDMNTQEKYESVFTFYTKSSKNHD
jgi:hypothetical protein